MELVVKAACILHNMCVDYRRPTYKGTTCFSRAGEPLDADNSMPADIVLVTTCWQDLCRLMLSLHCQCSRRNYPETKGRINACYEA
jgi:hypothetical protein